MSERLHTTFGGNVFASSSSSLETNRMYNMSGENHESTSRPSITADVAQSTPVEQQNPFQQLSQTNTTEIQVLPPAIPLPTNNTTSLPTVPKLAQVSSSASTKEPEIEKSKTKTSSTSTSHPKRQAPSPRVPKATINVNESSNCIQEVEKRGMRTPAFPVLTERWVLACYFHEI